MNEKLETLARLVGEILADRWHRESASPGAGKPDASTDNGEDIEEESDDDNSCRERRSG